MGHTVGQKCQTNPIQRKPVITDHSVSARTLCLCFWREREMERGLRAYRAVLRLVRRLPPDTRPYYSKFARENFVNYRQVDDTNAIQDLFQRAYTHSTWILQKYSVDQSAADRLKEICCR